MSFLGKLFRYIKLEWKKDGLRRLERKKAWYTIRGDTRMIHAANYLIDRKVREIRDLENDY